MQYVLTEEEYNNIKNVLKNSKKIIGEIQYVKNQCKMLQENLFKVNLYTNNSTVNESIDGLMEMYFILIM